MLFANSWYDVAWVAGMAPEFYELSAEKALCLIEPILVRQSPQLGTYKSEPPVSGIFV